MYKYKRMFLIFCIGMLTVLAVFIFAVINLNRKLETVLEKAESLAASCDTDYEKIIIFYDEKDYIIVYVIDSAIWKKSTRQFARAPLQTTIL